MSFFIDRLYFETHSILRYFNIGTYLNNCSKEQFEIVKCVIIVACWICIRKDRNDIIDNFCKLYIGRADMIASSSILGEIRWQVCNLEHNGKIDCNTSISSFSTGYLIFANMRFRQSYFLSIGEYQLAFRQLANIVLTFANWRIYYGETKIYWRIHYGKTKIYWRISARHSPIGEYTNARTNILFYIQLSRACALCNEDMLIRKDSYL